MKSLPPALDENDYIASKNARIKVVGTEKNTTPFSPLRQSYVKLFASSVDTLVFDKKEAKNVEKDFKECHKLAIACVLSWLERFPVRNKTDPAGWFFAAPSEIEKELFLPYQEQQKIFRVLKSLGIIAVNIDKRKDKHDNTYNPTRWIRIRFDVIHRLISPSTKHISDDDVIKNMLRNKKQRFV